MNITCDVCGSEYKLFSEKVPFRDSDSISCQVCGHVIHRWNQSYVWEAKLIKKAEKHKRNKD